MKTVLIFRMKMPSVVRMRCIYLWNVVIFMM